MQTTHIKGIKTHCMNAAACSSKNCPFSQKLSAAANAHQPDGKNILKAQSHPAENPISQEIKNHE